MLSEWKEAKEAAAQIGRKKVPSYVAQIPLASDYIEEGLSQFNESLQDYIDKN